MKNLLLLSVLAIFLFSCKVSENEDVTLNEDHPGFIYTSTNSTSGNAIIALGRNSDGTLTELENSPYPTGGAGDAAEGDFDTQWAIRIVGNYLLAVNAGANPVNGSVSVFKINKDDGSLTQVDQDPSTPAIDNMDSRGVRSASIAACGNGYIVVANQFANPNYQEDPPKAFGQVVSTNLRNLAVFTFDISTGILKFKSIGATYNSGIYGGPTTVEFNPDGNKLAVSTWGVPHFATPDADLSLQKPGKLIIYNFANGTLTQTGMFSEVGVSGNIGISWSPNGKYVYMSNFNLHSSKENNSLTVHDGTSAAKIQNFATAGRNDEGCWTWVSLNKQKLFVASFGENVVSVFDIGGDSKISQSLNPNFFQRGGGLPVGDTKDMHETPDGYLYVAGAFQSHSVTTFKMAADGSLTEVSGSPYYIPSSLGKTKEQHAFLGLTGFEK